MSFELPRTHRHLRFSGELRTLHAEASSGAPAPARPLPAARPDAYATADSQTRLFTAPKLGASIVHLELTGESPVSSEFPDDVPTVAIERAVLAPIATTSGRANTNTSGRSNAQPSSRAAPAAPLPSTSTSPRKSGPKGTQRITPRPSAPEPRTAAPASSPPKQPSIPPPENSSIRPTRRDGKHDRLLTPSSSAPSPLSRLAQLPLPLPAPPAVYVAMPPEEAQQSPFLDVRLPGFTHLPIGAWIVASAIAAIVSYFAVPAVFELIAHGVRG